MSTHEDLKKAREERDFLARRCAVAVLAGISFDFARELAVMFDKADEECLRLSLELSNHGDEA